MRDEYDTTAYRSERNYLGNLLGTIALFDVLSDRSSLLFYYSTLFVIPYVRERKYYCRSTILWESPSFHSQYLPYRAVDR